MGGSSRLLSLRLLSLLAIGASAWAGLASWEPGAPTGRGQAAVSVARAAGVPRATYELLQRISRPIRRCYAEALIRDPAFVAPDPVPGVRVRIPRASTSRALRFELIESSGQPALDRCLRRALRRVRVARDRRPPAEQYPVLFMPDGTPRVFRIR